MSCNLAKTSCNVKITVNKPSLAYSYSINQADVLHRVDAMVSQMYRQGGPLPDAQHSWMVAWLWMPTIYRGRVGSDLWLLVRGMMHDQDVRLLPLLMPSSLYDDLPRSSILSQEPGVGFTRICVEAPGLVLVPCSPPAIRFSFISSTIVSQMFISLAPLSRKSNQNKHLSVIFSIVSYKMEFY